MLSCRGLAKTYSGSVPVEALRSASLEVQRGEMVAIVGRSGSGKSTLLAILGLLETPTQGKLVLLGQDTQEMSSRTRSAFRATALGFAFQAFHLLPELTALENVSLALSYQGLRSRERRAASYRALEEIGLAHRISARARTLSGGEQQRVALARAIAHEPPLLLADEPTGNLDREREAEILDILRGMAKGGRSVVVVTHSLDVARAADRRLVMDDGVLGGAS